MKSRRLVGVTLFAVAGMAMTAAVATTATVAATPAANTAATANGAVTQQSHQTPSQVKAYWTTARMAAAQEVAIPQARASASAAPKQTSRLGTKIGAGSTPQVSLTRSATPNAPLAPNLAKSGIWRGHGKLPATTIGKLYFSTASGSAECTASVINSNNRSMIWTAGHCTNDGNGTWYSNFEFVPDYHNGIQPLGVWVWKSASTPSAYFNGANSDYDFAAMTLWPTNGVSVANATGWQGYQFNGGYVWPKTYEFGYPYDTHPARAGITGQDLRYCIGQTFQSGNQQAIHCDQGHGASGGPWLTNLLFPRGWGYLIGNVSYHSSDASNVENGPHFGDAAVNVWNAQTNA